MFTPRWESANVRSAQEIRFRLRQEAANLWLRFAKPSAPSATRPPSPLPWFPDPRKVAAAFEGSEYIRLADQILQHRFPLLGLTIDTGADIRWRRDYVHGIETDPQYFRRVPYLDFSRAGDHKVVWELNRHQHLVVLAQAWLFTSDRKYLDDVEQQLESWFEQNPFQCGMNWTSALEVAFRAFSWLWIWHIAGHDLRNSEQFRTGMFQHGLHLAYNLSVYFSPNTHLLGEAMVLHALGRMFQQDDWTATGSRIVQEEMCRQVRDDGSHFEQSAYYHVYALDMFVFHSLMDDTVTADYRDRVARMAGYLAALMGTARVLPLIGDDDGGRLFHPYGDRMKFGRASLATCSALFCSTVWPHSQNNLAEQCAWWTTKRPPLPQPVYESLRFEDSGVAVLVSGDLEVVVDAGHFGPGSGGHSHSDTLSFVMRRGGREVLIDPGTFLYVGDVEWRNRFRGSAAHNTVRIDGLDQATAIDAFRWADKPRVEIVEWKEDSVEAICRYRAFAHRRRVRLFDGHVYVTDTIEGPPGDHLVEQFWHWGDNGDPSMLEVDTGEIVQEEGWRSRAFRTKEPARVTCVRYRGPLPKRISAVIG
jgi:hypothetical protein